ncbi:hypothetical protein CLOM_g3017 [Closterium sp. NIES-68]|nr:hypothetical protein CLOM_g3017 [Closterium sp. NIES-68]GJP86565.1 hypothetical protein CLOP_g16574 [Closterium sp. NIES-67]
MASGMAPRARIAVYKVVWRTQLIPGIGGVAPGPGGVASVVDVEAAVDFAIQDKIDVLLVPLSGRFSPRASYFDHVSYLTAFEAGLTVVKPAGNRGVMLGVRTLENYSPFYLTVGASSISRSLAMDGARIKGYSSTTATTAATAATTTSTSKHHLASTSSSSPSSNSSLSPSAITPKRRHASLAALASSLEGVHLVGDWSRAQYHPMVRAASVARTAAGRRKASLCMPGSLNPLLALGKVLVCGSGGTTRQNKIAAAARAGARGVVLTYADTEGVEEGEGGEEQEAEEEGSGEGNGLGGENGGVTGGTNSTGGGPGLNLRGSAQNDVGGGAESEKLGAPSPSTAPSLTPPAASGNAAAAMAEAAAMAAGGGLPVMELDAQTSTLLGIRLGGIINLINPMLWLRFLQPLRPPVIDITSSTGPVAMPLARPAGGQPFNDLLKPDVIAPGVMLWAATPGGARTNRFRRLSGSSMAAAHVAGVAALIIQQNPTWLPGRIMSAIMTSARPINVYNRPIRMWNGLQADPWMMGSGHVNPAQVLDPGLTFDLTATDLKNFLAGQNKKRTAKIFPLATLEPIDGIQLNRPSIAVSHCAGTITVARTITNVGAIPATFVAKVKAPFLVIVKVIPPRITLAPGDSFRFLVSITGLVPRPRWNFVSGAIIFKDNYRHKIRIPITVQPSLF